MVCALGHVFPSPCCNGDFVVTAFVTVFGKRVLLHEGFAALGSLGGKGEGCQGSESIVLVYVDLI